MQKIVGDICRFWHLPSNGVIAKIILRDLDLLFEVKILNVNISETVRARENMHGKIFKDFDIYNYWYPCESYT